MFEIVNIVRRNRESCYDFATGKQLSIWQHYTAVVMVSAVLASLFSKMDIVLMGAVLTIYSILIGFSFNILFYLLSANKVEKEVAASLERTLRIERLHKLSDELFFNVSYFNVVSIIVVLLTLASFISFLPEPMLWALVASSPRFHSLVVVVSPILKTVSAWLGFVSTMLFYMLLIESMYSFVRTVGRVSFYFRLKMQLQSED